MKRWFRPVAYSLILLLLALAVFGGSPPAEGADESIVRPIAARPLRDAQESAGFDPLRARIAEAWSADLFAVPARAVEAPPPQVAEAPAAPPPAPDIKVLGWMRSDDVPHVFVEWAGESHTLKPSESVGDAYRFDRLEAGSADFTHLPTGEPRRYPVSDPALLE